jgi:hypothetical protein
MLPIGLLLVAQDVPFLKKPVGRAMLWLEHRWLRWKRRRQASKRGQATHAREAPAPGGAQNHAGERRENPF